MINAPGLLEVDVMVAAVDAADAAANVRLLSHQVLDPGRLTLVVEGLSGGVSCGAGCRSAAAQRTGRVISRKEIGRPEEDTQWLVMVCACDNADWRKRPRYPQRSEFAEAFRRCWHQYAVE